MQNKDKDILFPDEELLIKYFSDKVTTEEKSSIENWIERDSENKETIDLLAQIYFAQTTSQRIKKRNAIEAYNKVQTIINRKKKFSIARKIAVAASLFIGIIGIGTLMLSKADKINHTESTLITVSSDKNSRTNIVLPDGSEVCLNKNSTLSYPTFNSDNKRKVTLEGEAYFKVTHDKNTEFIVSLINREYEVKVLGTEFIIQAYKTDSLIQTTLINGSIELITTNNKKILEPSQKAIYSIPTKELDITAVDTDREKDWLYDRLVFKDTPMPTVFENLEKFYNVEFDIKNNIINTYTFTGTFENRSLFHILDYMKISSKIKYTSKYKKKGSEEKLIFELTI